MPRHVDTAARLVAVGDAVLSLAVEQGFGAVTIRAVADRIGASTSVVTHYVGGRDNMLRLAIRRQIDLRRAEGEAVLDEVKGAAGLRALVEWAVLSPDEQTHRVWLALVLGSRGDPVLRAELDLFNDWWDGRVRRLLADTGITEPDIDAACDVLDVMVDGLVLTGFDEGHPWSPPRRKRALTALWKALDL
ncbi:TetR/AcrR family transcriptional regulator [Nocardia sp. NPDC058518]|uniref:TetR/AcrR family transcriptional regulator n=1 Tax=Nocardia sp. NPDC058518 TaxID=3346534 RepID=UPI0036461365